VHDRRPLRDQPRDETAHAAAPDDFLDMAEETLPAFDRPLRRPQIGLVEHEMQRLVIRLVQRFGKSRHEAPARGVAAELRQIDDTDQRFSGNQAAESRPHFGGDRHIGMTAAKHYNRIAGGAAVGACPQSPPHPKRIHDRDTRAHFEQPLDKALGCVGLARAGGADDRYALIKSICGKSVREIVIASSSTDCAGMLQVLAGGARRSVAGSRPHRCFRRRPARMMAFVPDSFGWCIAENRRHRQTGPGWHSVKGGPAGPPLSRDRIPISF
jgi:hypothetical protein